MQSVSVRQDFSQRAPLVQKAPTTLCCTEWSSPATARPCRALEYLPRSLEIDDLHCPVVSQPSRAHRRPVQVTALTGHSRSSSPSRAEARARLSLLLKLAGQLHSSPLPSPFSRKTTRDAKRAAASAIFDRELLSGKFPRHGLPFPDSPHPKPLHRHTKPPRSSLVEPDASPSRANDLLLRATDVNAERPLPNADFAETEHRKPPYLPLVLSHPSIR